MRAVRIILLTLAVGIGLFAFAAVRELNDYTVAAPY